MVKVVKGSIADNLRKLRRPTRRTARVFFVLLAFCTGALVYILRSGDPYTQQQEKPIVRRARSQPITKHSRPQKTLPQFPDEYHSKGVLSLPYGDIVEPFEVWYSGHRGMSRIDYYGGMDRTYQRSDLGEHGFACKIVPEFSEKTEKTFKGCLHRKGTKQFHIKPQSIIPSFEFFKFDGHVDFRGKPCTRWKHSFKIYNKVNTYTFYTSRSQPYKPVRYELMGYDTLLSSYYDHYILEYHTFDAWKYDYSIFKIPTNVNCFDFTKENLAGAVGEINPMSEFMPHRHSTKSRSSSISTTPTPPPTKASPLEASENSLEFLLEQLKKMPYSGGTSKPTKPSTRAHTTTPSTTKVPYKDSSYQATLQHYEDILNALFSVFKVNFKKKYETHHEHERRKDIYRHNLRFIKSRNRQHLTYKLKPNHMADRTTKEIESQKGLLHGEERTLNGGHKFVLTEDRKTLELPERVDWRKAGAVGHVKSQGICGSCYAFAVAGALEGAYFIKTGSRLNLSEQQIVDCTWGFGNRGCKGGYPYRAMQWILKHGGLATEESYGRYLAQEGYCHFKNTTVGAKMESYMNIKKGNTTELKMAVAFYGPVTILINTQPKSFKFYGSGVYYDAQCTHALDHAAIAVGYGIEKGVPYWLVKNSWSQVWGDKGYIKIAMKKDNCGVTQKAVVVSAMPVKTLK